MMIGPCPCTPHARNTCEHSHICFLSYFVARSPISQSATLLKYIHEDRIFYMHAFAVCTLQAGLLVLLECVRTKHLVQRSAQKSMLYLFIGSSFVFMYTLHTHWIIRQRKHTSIQHNSNSSTSLALCYTIRLRHLKWVKQCSLQTRHALISLAQWTCMRNRCNLLHIWFASEALVR